MSRKKAVTTQNEELEALQARLRQTEQRLQQTSNSSDATNDRGSSTSTQQNDELGTTADHPGKKPIGSTREGYGVDQGVDSSTSTQQDDALGTTAGHPGRKPVGSSREGFGVDQAVDDSVSSQDTRPPVAKGISYSIAHMPGAMPQTPGEDDFQAAWNSATPERPEQR